MLLIKHLIILAEYQNPSELIGRLFRSPIDQLLVNDEEQLGVF